MHAGRNKNEIEPNAHGKFDDSKREVVADPSSMKKARKDPEKDLNKFTMAWYRIKITVPERVDGKDVAGTALWFKTTVDDYAEVWVNGRIDLARDKTGRGAISGFNFPNEVQLTANAQPGQTIQVAVLATNAPFGNPPGNFIFFRNAELRFMQK